MLYNLNWLQPGKNFPPETEEPRILRYKQNAMLFDGEHFADSSLRSRNPLLPEPPVNVYKLCAERICRVIGNFDDIISFPVLLNYQRLMSLKTADLVCGEYPTISAVTLAENEAIKDVRDSSDFDEKLYATVLDISRYGDAVWRIFKNEDTGKQDFTCWRPLEWYPIVKQDGTYRIEKHCICWIENISEDESNPIYKLHVQIHGCSKEDFGHYEHRIYSMSNGGTSIGPLDSAETVATGLNRCAVMSLRAFATSDTVYGYDDYMTIDSLLAEIMARVGQISGILDKHADPSMTGPVSMLEMDPHTGEYHLKTGKFFAVSQGEEHPEYLTWDGQLSSAFKQLEFLVNQLYILSEMGAALLGGQDGSSQAISGTAMRFKMVNPLAKVRRIANSLTLPVRQLFSSLSVDAEVDDIEAEDNEPLTLPIPYRKISVLWADGLPDDPRENIENAKLATGETRMMPLEKALMEYFGKSNEEARSWVEQLRKEAEERRMLELASQSNSSSQSDDKDPNHPGPQDGTGVNPNKKGSQLGLTEFHGINNQ